MRKLLTFVIALTGIAFGAMSIGIAHTDGIYNPGANSVNDTQGIDNPKATSGASCTPGTQATNFLARTSGLSGTETTAYCNLINGLVTDGIITGTLSGAAGCGSVLDALYIVATNTTTTANLNLCGTSFGLVKTGTVTFTADVGYTGDGSTGFLDTQWIPITNAVNFTLNSASIGAYIQTNQVTADASVIMGSATTGEFSYMSPMNTGSVFTFNVNDNTFTGPANTTAKGAWAASRTSSSQINLYKNGSTTPFGANAAASSTALPSSNMLLLALSNNGTPAVFTTYQGSAFFMGGGLTSTQAVAINNRINAYMTALGHAVY
jgi:hypothetical protein